MPRLRARRGLAIRATWGVADQAAISIGSLLLSVLLARLGTREEFGAFAIAFTIYALALTCSRATASMTYMMDSRGGAQMRSASDVAVVTGAVAAGTAIGIAVLAVALPFTDGPVQRFLVVTALGMPFLLGQDSIRFVVQLRRGVRALFFVDLSWLLFQAAALAGWVLVAQGERPEVAVLLWGVTAGASLALAAALLRLRLSLRAARTFFTGTWRTAVGNFVESVVVTGSAQLATFVLAALATLETIGALRGAQVLFGPLNVVLGGLLVLLTPYIISAGSRSGRSVLRATALSAAGLTAVAGLLTVALTLLPSRLGAAVLGETWSAASDVVVPTGIAFAAGIVASCATLGFKGLQVVAVTVRLRILLLPVASVGAAGGYLAGGLVGAAVGLAVAGLLTAATLWAALGREVKRTPSSAEAPVLETTSGRTDR